MAHQDDVVFVDDDDAVEAEFADRRRDLMKLLFGMQAGVSRVGLQTGNRQMFDAKITHTSLQWGAAHI
jgi:hypothetical protein